MAAYQGPERRTVITFTREDSDRLVRLEQKLLDIDSKLDSATQENAEIYGRLNKAERKLSWIAGIGTTITFIITTALAAFGLFHDK